MAAGFRSTPQELVLVVRAKKCCVVVVRLFLSELGVHSHTMPKAHKLLHGPNRLHWPSWFL